MFIEKDRKKMKTANTILKKDCEGIPVKTKGLKLNKERAFLSGSLTMEAALALPIFLFFMMALISFLLVVSLQSEIQLTMEETARSLGKKAYFAEHASIGTAETEEDGDTAGLLSAGINSLTIKTWLLKDGLEERLDASRIVGGSSGFYVYRSSYDRDTGILDIIVNYTYRFPFLPESIGKVRMVQRCRSHVWTGSKLKDQTGGGDGTEQEGTTVYVTPYGSAYHLSTECPYLKLSIQSLDWEAVEAARNKDGSKYYMCPDCCRKGETYSTVYVTDYGTVWHSDIHCSGLKRTIEAIDISEVGGRHVCPMCGGTHP